MALRALPFLVLAACGTFASATNLYFIHGDAFFPSKLVEESFEAWEAGDLVLEHSSIMRGWAAGCGNAGSTKLRVTGDTASVRARLKELYGALREAYPKELIQYQDGTTRETNGFWLFVYNRDLDFSKRHVRLGVKYNEDWVAQTQEQYDLRDGDVNASAESAYYAKYGSFVDTEEAVVLDWKIGPWIPPLKLSREPEHQNAEVSVDVDEVQFVVVPNDLLEPYFEKLPKRAFYSVVNDEIRACRIEKRMKVERRRLGSLDDVVAIEWGEELDDDEE